MEKLIQSKSSTDSTSILLLLAIIVGITILYQTRQFLTDDEFMFISVPSYSIIPAFLVVISSILTIKLYKTKHYQAKAFLLFALGAACWFVAEQIWAAYDHIWEGEPFPSEADFFYISAYPFFIGFLILSLRPVKKAITKNVWLFSIGISIALLVPTFLVTFEDMEGERAFEISVALAYPIASAVLLVPALIGILFLFKSPSNYFWMLLLFGFICYIVADTVFLYAILDDTYYDGHPVDLLYLYSFILLIFSVIERLKLVRTQKHEKESIFYSDKIKFETITKFGLPLTVAIISMVVIISTIHSLYIEGDQHLNPQSLLLGIITILAVFSAIIITVNKSLTRMVQMRTQELEEQRSSLEDLVEEKTQQLLKTERLSAIGELSGRLSHDLRNPLSVIKMSVDLLKQSNPDTKISDESVSRRLDMIDKSIERISHQVDEVLGFVRHSPLELKIVSLKEIIQKSIDKVNIPTDISVTIDQKNISIRCDPVKLEAVFINLIVNAIQAMPNGGDISIKFEEQGSDVLIKFENSGPSIPEEIQDKIFEPLFTTKQTGTGLGLASCKNIIEEHGGKVSVQNNPTSFIIRLSKTH